MTGKNVLGFHRSIQDGDTRRGASSQHVSQSLQSDDLTLLRTETNNANEEDILQTEKPRLLPTLTTRVMVARIRAESEDIPQVCDQQDHHSARRNQAVDCTATMWNRVETNTHNSQHELEGSSKSGP